MKRHLIKGYIFVILSAVIFGLMPLMAKFIYDDGVNSLTLVLFRNIISAPILALLARLSGASLKITSKALPKISGIAVMGCCITPLLLFSSYTHIPSGTATVFHFVYPAAVVLGEFIFLKNKFTYGHIISVFMCVAGICLFYNPQDSINLTGSVFAILSGITYAIYVIMLSGFKHKEISGFVFSFYVSLVCSVVMLVVCIATNTLALPATFTGWGLSVVFAIAVNVGAVVLFQKGTFIAGGARASILSTFEPVTSIIAGVLIFNEKINLQTFVGAVMVICASILIAVYDIKKQNL